MLCCLLIHVFLCLILGKSIASSKKSLANVTLVPYPHNFELFNGTLFPGRWTFDDEDRSFVGLDDIQKAAYTQGVYLPVNGSSFHIFSANEALSCFQDKTIYLFGDSYIVQTYIGLADILTNSASMKEIEDRPARDRLLRIRATQVTDLLKEYNSVFKYLGQSCRHEDLGKCS